MCTALRSHAVRSVQVVGFSSKPFAASVADALRRCDEYSGLVCVTAATCAPYCLRACRGALAPLHGAPALFTRTILPNNQ
jgi:hypothetical protein